MRREPVGALRVRRRLEQNGQRGRVYVVAGSRFPPSTCRHCQRTDYWYSSICMTIGHVAFVTNVCSSDLYAT